MPNQLTLRQRTPDFPASVVLQALRMRGRTDERSIAMPNPVETPEDYIRVHQQLDFKVKKAIATPCPRVQISVAAYESLGRSGRTSLKANNAEARIALAVGLYRAIDDLRQQVEPIFWVAMVRREHAVPLSKAAAFDVTLAHRWVTEVLAGWNFLGMIEAGYFSNIRDGFDQEHRWISWHTHLVCWGKSRAELTRLRDETNLWTPGFLQGRDAMQFYKPASARLPGLMLYSAKSPISDYRIFRPASADGADGDAAVICRLEQRKRPLRPGDAIRTCNAMGNRTLAELIVAGGDAVEIARRLCEQLRLLMQ